MTDLSQFKKNDKFLMLAFDHRGSFKKLLNPESPDSVSDEEAIRAKKEIIDALRGEFSSILIDQEIGFKAYAPKDKPFLLPVEKSGYEQQGGERVTQLEYSVGQLKEMGAAGVKILLWLNYRLSSAKKQIVVARKVLEDCKLHGLPYFLETRSYDPAKGEGKQLSDEDMDDLVIGGIKMLLEEGVRPDVFKLEYPGSALGCQKITAILGDTPWILLTMGAGFKDFAKQLEEATVRGCQGFLAGRAVWQDVCSLTGEEKDKFLKETLVERFRRICEIASSN